MLAQRTVGGKRLLGWGISGTGHHHIRLAPLVSRSPLPDSNSTRAMLDRRFQVEPLQHQLRSSNNYIDVVSAAEAVISYRKESVRIRRTIYALNIPLLVHNVVDEAGVLVGEAVVVLAPNV